ncbi:AAA family ATPase, partial [Acinetobacter baumannii]
QNYAIIDAIEIDFHSGLNIITGETGAGKSILMGALGLILGGRADSSSLLNKDKKSIIEGFFAVKEKKLVIDFLQEEGFDYEGTL